MAIPIFSSGAARRRVRFLEEVAGPFIGFSVDGTIPAHQTNDIIVSYAYTFTDLIENPGGGSPPATPSGWTSIATSTASSASEEYDYRLIAIKATSGSTVATGWPTSTGAVAVYRGFSNFGNGSINNAMPTGTPTTSYTTFTLQVGTGSSWVMGMAQGLSASAPPTLPSGSVNRADRVDIGLADINSSYRFFDTGAGVSSWNSTSAGNAYVAAVVELRA